VFPPWQYSSDRDDAEASGKAMARLLLRLAEFLGETNAGGEQCALLPRLARRIHVYDSADDRALVISDETKFNPGRLGFNGPHSFPRLSTRIAAVDCELVDKTKLTHVNPQYDRPRPEVIADVRAVLSETGRPETFPWREAIGPGRRYRIRLAEPETMPND